jgi:hypothetical protein
MPSGNPELNCASDAKTNQLHNSLLAPSMFVRPVTMEILETRSRMFEQLLQTFWAKKPRKKSADLHPRQGNLLHWNIFTGLNKTSLHFTSQNM